MKKKSLLLVFVLLSMAMGWLPASQEQDDSPRILADNTTIREDFITASGHVEVTWHDYVIYADVVEYNQKTREVFAEGRVTMSSREMVLSGEKLKLNLKNQTGELVDTYGLISPFVRYDSDKLTQVDQQTLSFQRLRFTSCAQISPRWTITSRRGKIKKDKYVEMSHVLLRIKNIPILYLPYMRYPIQKDGRATGFLFPNIGNSSLRGFSLQNSFFWNIRPNLDMTLSLDYYAKLGIGLGDELRYLFKNTSGNARVYYFMYRESSKEYSEYKDDYYVEAEHKQTLPFLNSRLVFKVNHQSRPDFLRLFDNSFDRLLSANFQSSFSWTANVANLSMALNASRRETFYIFAGKSRILEYLPALSISLAKQKLGKLPGYLTLSVDFQSLRRGGVTYESEPFFVSNLRSQRLTVVPSYQLPLLKLPWLNFSLHLQSKHTNYAKSLDPESQTVVDEPLYLKYHTVQAFLQGPVFFRIFGSGQEKIKHTIEPEFEFRYVTKVTNRERLIPVDYFDYPSYSYAGFSLTSRLLAKNAGKGNSSNELLSLRVAQEYYFDPAEANFFRKIDGVYPRFSEFSTSLRLRPNSSFSLDAILAYNYYIKGLSRLNLRLGFVRADAPLTGSISFSAYKNPFANSDYVFNRSLIRSDLQLAIPRFPVKLRAGADYDLTDREFRYGAVSASFDYQCLVFNGEIKIFSYFGRAETQFRFGVSFGNLGMVSDFFGGQ